jgi:hypothetical protein
MCRNKKLVETVEVPVSTEDEPDAPTCSKCCEEEEIARMKMEIKRLYFQ